MNHKIERRPMTLFFNQTPVEVVSGEVPGIEQSFLAGEWCTLVRWPNGDVDWRSAGELRLTPKPELPATALAQVGDRLEVER